MRACESSSEERACEHETVVVVSAMVFACMLCVYSSPNSLNSLICGVSECPGLRVTLEHIVKER